LACSVVSCAPAVVALRINLGFFPITFFSLCLAELLGGLAAWHWPGRAWSAAVLAFVLVASIPRVLLAQESLHPHSIDRVVANADLLFNPDHPRPRIPAHRLAAMRAELARAGVDESGDYVAALRRLNGQLIREGRRTPDGDRLFSPWIHWLDS
jgi:hypothetical protein